MKEPVTFRHALRGLALDLMTLTHSRRPGIRLLYCHYVFDDQIEQFRVTIESLLEVGRFISDSELIDIVKEESTINEALFHISFDDGFRNIVRNALPILKKYGVPSTFFVPSALIGADYDAVRHYCLNVANYRSVIEMANWDELKQAMEGGMSIGSHTRTHARFSEISRRPDLLKDEILGSKLEIEARLGAECRTISWPFGRTSDADEESLSYVRHAGYEACFGAFRGRVVPGETQLHYLPRHHFEPQWPLRHIRFFATGGRDRA